MTVKEYLEGRERFKKYGRQGEDEQRKARKRYRETLEARIEKELVEEGFDPTEAGKKAQEEAAKRMKTLAALHIPDQAVGGGPEIGGMGDSQVNSSIGASWNRNSRVDSIDEAALRVPEAERATTKMNLKLERSK